MSTKSDFKLSYSTMFDPPAALHLRFDQSLAKGFIELWALPSKISAKRAQKHK